MRRCAVSGKLAPVKRVGGVLKCCCHGVEV
mgnify:CR=1 FL=1